MLMVRLYRCGVSGDHSFGSGMVTVFTVPLVPVPLSTCCRVAHQPMMGEGEGVKQEHTDTKTDRHKNRQAHRHKNRQAHRDRQTQVQTQTQTNTHTPHGLRHRRTYTSTHSTYHVAVVINGKGKSTPGAVRGCNIHGEGGQVSQKAECCAHTPVALPPATPSAKCQTRACRCRHLRCRSR